MDGFACVCEASFGRMRGNVDADAVTIRSNGRMPTSSGVGFIVWRKPTHSSATSVNEMPFWRAGCGKTACPVRRAGRGQSLVPTPIGRGEVRDKVPGKWLDESLGGILPVNPLGPA